jgi:hypothetical protein
MSSPLARALVILVILVLQIAFIIGAVAIAQVVGERMGIAPCCPPQCGCRSATITTTQPPETQ